MNNSNRRLILLGIIILSAIAVYYFADEKPSNIQESLESISPVANEKHIDRKPATDWKTLITKKESIITLSDRCKNFNSQLARYEHMKEQLDKLKSRLWVGFFTYRKEKVRIISVRKARKGERTLYES